MLTFGQTLQKIRRGKELTQRDVANAISMDYSYYSKLENDRFGSNPTRETVEKIAASMNCDEDEKNDLLVAAGRMSDDFEQAALLAKQNPEMRKPLGKLFKAVFDLTPEKLDEITERVEKEAQKLKSHNPEEK